MELAKITIFRHLCMPGMREKGACADGNGRYYFGK